MNDRLEEIEERRRQDIAQGVGRDWTYELDWLIERAKQLIRENRRLMYQLSVDLTSAESYGNQVSTENEKLREEIKMLQAIQNCTDPHCENEKPNHTDADHAKPTAVTPSEAAERYARAAFEASFDPAADDYGIDWTSAQRMLAIAWQTGYQTAQDEQQERCKCGLPTRCRDH